MRVLVATASTADDRKTLAAVRSLGRAGSHVAVGGDRFFRSPFHSRHCRERVRYPAPVAGIEDFVQSLLAHVASGRYDALLPLCDYTTVPVSRHRSEFERFVGVPVPEYESLRKAHDKSRLLALANDIGIDVPSTHVPPDVDAAQTIAADLGYRCVIKPRQGAGAVGVRFPESPAQVEAAFAQRPRQVDLVFDASDLLLQEFVPGEIHDVCALFRHGEPRALLSQRRIRMYPDRGGVGILNETTDEPELKEMAAHLLRTLHWHGPAQVEFRVDPDSGRKVLIEVNARFWGTLDLAIQSGIDFPSLACRMAVEGDVDPAMDYRTGIRYRWALPYGVLWARETGRWLDASRLFAGPDRNAYSDLRWTDPMPHLVSVLGTAARTVRRRK